VLDTPLADRQWLADDYSIADIANWCWVRTYKWSGVSVEGLDHLQRWLARMHERPACQKGIEVPFKMPDIDDGEAAKEFARGAQTLLTR